MFEMDMLRQQHLFAMDFLAIGVNDGYFCPSVNSFDAEASMRGVGVDAQVIKLICAGRK